MTRLDLRLDPDVREQDRRRGHRFQLPAAVAAKVPGIYGTEGTALDDKVVHAHYFVGGWDWYVVELDPDTYRAFAFVCSLLCPEGEWGYVDLADLALQGVTASIGGRPFRQPVERDKWWQPCTFAEVSR